jgi:5-methylcytosine-specific restriction endonuclease McrA
MTFSAEERRERNREAQRKWRLKNPNYQVEWNRKNPDKVSAYRKATYAKPETKERLFAWRIANPQKVNAARIKADLKDPPKDRQRRYRERNLDACRKRAAAYMAEWKKQNPERHKASRRAWEEKNRALLNTYSSSRRSKICGTLSSNLVEILMEEQSGKCPYCLLDIREKFSLDHYVPLSRGGSHEDDNIQLTCSSCNSRKGNKDPLIFFKKSASWLCSKESI